MEEEKKELESDFLLNLSAVSDNRDEPGDLYTAKQSLKVTIDLPKEAEFENANLS